jgi:hypothetical protein
MGQKLKVISFDDLVGAGKQGRWQQRKAEGTSGQIARPVLPAGSARWAISERYRGHDCWSEAIDLGA